MRFGGTTPFFFIVSSLAKINSKNALGWMSPSRSFCKSSIFLLTCFSSSTTSLFCLTSLALPSLFVLRNATMFCKFLNSLSAKSLRKIRTFPFNNVSTSISGCSKFIPFIPCCLMTLRILVVKSLQDYCFILRKIPTSAPSICFFKSRFEETRFLT